MNEPRLTVALTAIVQCSKLLDIHYLINRRVPQRALRTLKHSIVLSNLNSNSKLINYAIMNLQYLININALITVSFKSVNIFVIQLFIYTYAHLSDF